MYSKQCARGVPAHFIEDDGERMLRNEGAERSGKLL